MAAQETRDQSLGGVGLVGRTEIRDRVLRRTLRRLRDFYRQVPFAYSICRGDYVGAPHPVKMRILKRHIPGHGQCVFVETGTFLGDTVAALKKSCKKIVSIEIDPALYRICLERFEDDPNVELLLGDCIERLPTVLEMLGESAVFWLDGHWSGGATGRGQVDDPIMISLSQIAGHPIKTHTIMIDDARCFDGSNHRPVLSEVLGTLQNINRSYRILVHHDIIVATL